MAFDKLTSKEQEIVKHLDTEIGKLVQYFQKALWAATDYNDIKVLTEVVMNLNAYDYEFTRAKPPSENKTAFAVGGLNGVPDASGNEFDPAKGINRYVIFYSKNFQNGYDRGG